MVNMTKAGEIGGFLDSVMLQIAENYETEVKLRGKIKSAMTYPVVVFVMAMLAVCRHVDVHRPEVRRHVQDTRRQAAAADPDPGHISATCSRSPGPFAVRRPHRLRHSCGASIKHHEQRSSMSIDPLKLKIPVFGPLFQKIALRRFARNLGTMMRSGVPILQSLDIVADTTGNIVLARAVRDVQESVRTGESLAGPLNHHDVFPPMVVQMMAVGEDTGALDTMLRRSPSSTTRRSRRRPRR